MRVVAFDFDLIMCVLITTRDSELNRALTLRTVSETANDVESRRNSGLEAAFARV